MICRRPGNGRRLKAADAEAASRGVDPAGMNKLFSAFDQVKFAEPVTRRGRTYDDKKFFDSLKQQAQSGKLLSEKQLEALGKIAVRYRDEITDYPGVAAILNLPGEGELAAAESIGSSAREEAGVLLEQLSKVTEWAPAERKGRRTYDDKAFYQSLSEQFNGGRALSDKQLTALKKLAEKYQK